MQKLLILAACFMLAGCLTTTKPVFDDTNSVKAGASPAFVKFVAAWEAAKGTSDSPRGMIKDGKRVADLGGLIVVEDVKSNGRAEYIAVGLLGSRLMVCAGHDDKVKAIAGRHGVKVEISRSATDDKSMPAAVLADGTRAQLHAFVLDYFRSGTLVCHSEALGFK